MTRTELAEALAEPGALANAEADERRAEAEHYRDQMMTKLHAALERHFTENVSTTRRHETVTAA